MANDEYREPQEASRDAGLRARHETRLERHNPPDECMCTICVGEVRRAMARDWRRAIRREVAEEVAVAIETHFPHVHDDTVECQRCFLVREFAGVARGIGSKGGSDD